MEQLKIPVLSEEQKTVVWKNLNNIFRETILGEKPRKLIPLPKDKKRGK